jgi:DNA-binding transcriptional LysR family regulator
MDILALKTVLLVQVKGSIAGAARVLGVSPSSVSRILAGVEAELGIRLFHRSTRHLTTTEEGRAYLQRIAPLIEELDAAKEAASGSRQTPGGLLRMTASVAFSQRVIVPLLPDFHHRFPSITVELLSSDTNLDLIGTGIDLAVRLTPAPEGDLISRRLMRTHYQLVCSPGYLAQLRPPVTPDDLSSLNCLRFALPGLQNTWRFRHGENVPFDIPVSGNLLISNAGALREAVIQGLGIGMFADWMIRDDLREGRLVPLLKDYECTLSDFDTGAWALYPNRAYLPQKVRVMIDFLSKRLGK